MTPEAQPIANHRFQPGGKYFVDANVWLLIFGPQRPGKPSVDLHSRALALMLKTQCHIYTDVLVISEFINTYARLMFHQIKGGGSNYKTFRQTSAFKPIARDIASDTKRVLKICTRIDDEFATLDAMGLLDAFSKGESDFNDQVFTDLCKRKGFTLVTHDADFRDCGVPVLTANQRLLD